jgi:hypothetical protein
MFVKAAGEVIKFCTQHLNLFYLERNIHWNNPYLEETFLDLPPRVSSAQQLSSQALANHLVMPLMTSVLSSPAQHQVLPLSTHRRRYALLSLDVEVRAKLTSAYLCSNQTHW